MIIIHKTSMGGGKGVIDFWQQRTSYFSQKTRTPLKNKQTNQQKQTNKTTPKNPHPKNQTKQKKPPHPKPNPHIKNPTKTTGAGS